MNKSLRFALAKLKEDFKQIFVGIIAFAAIIGFIRFRNSQSYKANLETSPYENFGWIVTGMDDGLCADASIYEGGQYAADKILKLKMCRMDESHSAIDKGYILVQCSNKGSSGLLQYGTTPETCRAGAVANGAYARQFLGYSH